MATYPKKTIAAGTGTHMFARKIDNSVTKPAGGVDGYQCHFCRRPGDVNGNYITLENPFPHFICTDDATAIKDALDSVAE